MSKGGFNFKGKVQANKQQFNSGGGNIQGNTSSEVVAAILSATKNTEASTNGRGFNFESDVIADSQQFNEGGGNVQITHQSEQINKSIIELQDMVAKNKVTSDRDKELMCQQIATISTKLANIPNQESMNEIIESISDIIEKGNVTMDRLRDLEKDVNKFMLINEEKNDIVVKAVYKIVYDNPLLNDLELLNSAVRALGADTVLDLGSILSKEQLVELMGGENAAHTATTYFFDNA